MFFFLIVIFSLNIKAQQLVLPGDNPDPSVVKIGDTYWASATTSNWLPAYPLLKSKDLVNWKMEGSIFNKLPEWADYYFWAPEVTYDKGRVYVYYTAHKKNGNLCVAVASADKPEGPYRDHGPLICQEVGSIDAFPMRDENGKLHIIWKEDGNSVGKPTPIWISEMNEERTALISEKKELFRNEQPWEANLVEGVSMIKHGDYFYAFYAAAGCCGPGCTYVSGVARSKSLFGPWEKYDKNPLLVSTEKWKCPGHGTPVEMGGKFYFLYHAYDAKSGAFAGRQGLLQEFVFTSDGWIQFMDTASDKSAIVPLSISDEFKGRSLSELWQWSVFQNLDYKLTKGNLELSALPVVSGSYIGQKTYTADYTADAVVSVARSTAESGIAAIGDDNNIVTMSVAGDTLRVSVIKRGNAAFMMEKTVKTKDKLHLRMQVKNGKDITFLYSTTGKDFKVFNDESIDATFLPPWDRAIRAGLTSKGDAYKTAVFESFSLKSIGE
ncbi:family 43 glycosylhydrolase [Arcticibacter tournemirensis]|uniref:Family 43 glycosylhydrolase n=1 Tax=Arcticibacter tournemirensis TaxID=699437 RepID=A0A5M9H912_9SPHI|nr:family 43 glycosylhydrolase [Arcticibacter tournemirensis]